MTCDSSNREKELFERALEIASVEERRRYLESASAGDAVLLARIEALLRAHETGEDFLPERPQQTVRLNIPTEKPSDKIGRYKLLQPLGEGGCGIVYMAEQEDPVKRRVALKIIKLGMDTKSVIARFEAERQALAMMDHPNIAKVLDAGATETGRPYFVMELVRGIKLTDYCDQNNLSTEGRLKLFMQVCQAIQHAHQKGIIHRDIKPSNVLVTLHDGVPVPKVIDFGIAKATQGRLTDQTLFTAFEQFIGTPAYMSPEQAEMSGLDIDTRTDIYSLGVLLYELLTGRTPFDAKELLNAGLDALRKIIREKEPQRPSTKLSTMEAEALTSAALHRHTDAPKLIHLVRGDLDWIAMKALEKDRTRRYETANGLAMDVQRYLRDEPIVARPPSAVYRLQKALHRNKLAFAGGAAVGLALILGVTGSLWQAVRATRAEKETRLKRDAANKARQQAEAINKFLTEDLLFQATPDKNARERKITMEEVLERAARNLEQNSELARQPEIKATLRLAVGNTYSKLGLLTQAEAHLRDAVNLRRSALGLTNSQTLIAQAALAEFLVLGARKFAEGEAISHETWVARQKLLGPEHPDTLDSMSTYFAAIAIPAQNGERVEPLARQVLALRERVNGSNDFSTIDALGNLAYVLASQGKYAEAERYARDELARFKHSGFADRINALYSANNLALYRMIQGDNVEGEQLLLEVIPRALRTYGQEHPVTLHLQHNLARIYANEGRLENAEALAREVLIKRRRATPTHEGIGRTLLILGRVLLEQGKLDEAEPLLKEALDFFRDHYSMKANVIAQVENSLGAIQLARGKYAEAEPYLTQNAEEFFRPSIELSSHETQTALGNVIKLYQAWGKPERVSHWQKRINALVQTRFPAETRLTTAPK